MSTVGFQSSFTEKPDFAKSQNAQNENNTCASINYVVYKRNMRKFWNNSVIGNFPGQNPNRNFLPEMKKNDFVFPSHMTDPRIYYTSVAKISFCPSSLPKEEMI